MLLRACCPAFLSACSLFIFTSGISTAAVDRENMDSLICIPNATFHIDCNRCKCSPTGMSIDCTDWSCATLTIPYDLLLNVTLNCWSSEIFLYESQKCLCAESGSWALCSSARYELAHNLRPTSGSVVALDDRTVVGTGRQCAPGLVFKKACDTCICSESGEPACLDLGCIADRRVDGAHDRPANIPEKLCVPRATFSIDCNQCACSSDGYSYACDPFPCLGVEIRADQLLNLTFPCDEPGSVFLYNDHECLCARDGKHALCSRAKVNKSKEYRAANGKVFAIAEFPDLCTPGTIFKDKCNVCICGKDQKAACTRMDCEIDWTIATESTVAHRLVPREEVWIQREKNRRFCRNNPASMYCKYLASYG